MACQEEVFASMLPLYTVLYVTPSPAQPSFGMGVKSHPYLRTISVEYQVFLVPMTTIILSGSS